MSYRFAIICRTYISTNLLNRPISMKSANALKCMNGTRNFESWAEHKYNTNSMDSSQINWIKFVASKTVKQIRMCEFVEHERKKNRPINHQQGKQSWFWLRTLKIMSAQLICSNLCFMRNIFWYFGSNEWISMKSVWSESQL